MTRAHWTLLRDFLRREREKAEDRGHAGIVETITLVQRKMSSLVRANQTAETGRRMGRKPRQVAGVVLTTVVMAHPHDGAQV